MNEYMAIDSGGYLCTNSFRALIAAWLDASKMSLDGVRSTRCVRSARYVLAFLSGVNELQTYLYLNEVD